MNLQIFRRDSLIKVLEILSLGLIPFIIGLPIIKMWPVRGGGKWELLRLVIFWLAEY